MIKRIIKQTFLPLCLSLLFSLVISHVVGASYSTINDPSNAVKWTGVQTVEVDGLGTTPTDGYVLQNLTPAAAGAQQASPVLRFQGQGWKTTATAASQPVDFQLFTQPVQGATAPSGSLLIQSQANNGGYTTLVNISGGGGMSVLGSVIGGTLSSTTVAVGTAGVSNLISYATNTGASQASALYQFAGSTGVNIRNALGGNGNTINIATGSNYANTVISSSGTMTSTTGTHSWLANLAVLPMGTVTNNGATVTNTASLYVDGPGAGGTNNYSLYVKGSIASAATQTTVSCSTSGSVIFSEPENGPSYKVVIAYENACLGTASYTFPNAFTNTPDSLGVNAVKFTSISTSATTITGTTTTGFSQLYGY